MKKVLDFLEKNVQWIALGLGGLILLIILAQNLPGFSTPVSATLGPRKVGPGEIDSVINTEVAQPLQKIMTDDVITTTIKVPAYTETFVARMSVASQFAQLPDWMFKRNLALIDPNIDITTTNDIGRTALLPTLPPVAMGPVFTVQTHIKQIEVQPAVDPVPGPDGAPVPVPPLPNAAGAPAPEPIVLAPARDASVVRVQFKLEMARINEQLQTAKIPESFQLTMPLKVVLVRQRALPDGSWGETTNIEPLIINAPQGIPFPSREAKIAEKDSTEAYLKWAVEHQASILQPMFPDFEGDDPLALAPPVDSGANLELSSFDPRTFRGDVSKLPPDQRNKVLEARRQDAKAIAEQRRKDGDAKPPSPQSNASDQLFGPLMPLPPSARLLFFQVTSPGDAPPPVPEDGSVTAPQEPTLTMTNRITADPPPEAPFRPAEKLDIDCWAFDDTAKPGETYRYRVSYYMLNPLFGTKNVAENPDDERIIWLASEDDNWSSVITTPPLTHVFLAQAPPSNFASAKFVIFHWQDGRRHKFTGTFKPGDTISGSQDGVNFVSNWTLADIRASAGSGEQKNLVTLVEPGGGVEVRDFDTDKEDPLFKKLDEEVKAASAKPAQPPQPNQPQATAR